MIFVLIWQPPSHIVRRRAAVVVPVRSGRAASPPAPFVGQSVAPASVAYHQPSTRHSRQLAHDCRTRHADVLGQLERCHRSGLQVADGHANQQQHVTSTRGKPALSQQRDGQLAHVIQDAVERGVFGHSGGNGIGGYSLPVYAPKTQMFTPVNKSIHVCEKTALGLFSRALPADTVTGVRKKKAASMGGRIWRSGWIRMGGRCYLCRRHWRRLPKHPLPEPHR